MLWSIDWSNEWLVDWLMDGSIDGLIEHFRWRQERWSTDSGWRPLWRVTWWKQSNSSLLACDPTASSTTATSIRDNVYGAITDYKPDSHFPPIVRQKIWKKRLTSITRLSKLLVQTTITNRQSLYIVVDYKTKKLCEISFTKTWYMMIFCLLNVYFIFARIQQYKFNQLKTHTTCNFSDFRNIRHFVCTVLGEGVVLGPRFFVSFGKYWRMMLVCKIIEIFWYHNKTM